MYLYVQTIFILFLLTDLVMMIVGIFVADFSRLLLIVTNDGRRACYILRRCRAYTRVYMRVYVQRGRISSRLVEIDRATTMF